MSGHESGGQIDAGGRPIGRPVAEAHPAVSPVVTDVHDELRAANDGSPSDSRRVGVERRISRRQLNAIDDNLRPHERQILDLLDRLRFARARTLHQLVDSRSIRRERATRRTVRRLIELGLVAELPRRVGGTDPGSDRLVVHLTSSGDRLARATSGRTIRRRNDALSTRFLQHCLDVGDAIGRLVAELPSYDLTVSAWQSEPTAWRRHQLGTSLATLKPDLYVEISRGDEIWAFFLEIDRGTESVPTVMRQLHAYEQYRRTGAEQAQYGTFPVVVVACYPGPRWPADVRAASLHYAVRQTAEAPEQLVHITPAAELVTVIAALTSDSDEVSS